MPLSSFTLGQLGWRPYFAQQVTLEEVGALVPARVAAVHRTVIEVLTEAGEQRVTPGSPVFQHMLSASIAVGDWVLLEPATARAIRVLDRQSTLARLAAGERQ